MKRCILGELAVTLLAITILPGLASASLAVAEPPLAQTDAVLIQDLARDVKSRWGVSIDPRDYDVQMTPAGRLVKPKGPEVAVKVTTESDGSTHVAMSAPSDSRDVKQLTPATGSTMQEGVTWPYPAWCSQFFSDEDGVGQMRWCHQQGFTTYPGNPKRYWVTKTWATCSAKKGGPDFWEVDECYSGTQRRPGLPDSWRLNVHDWNPRSTQYPPGTCGQIPLNVTVGPFSVGHTVNTCEKLVPSPGPREEDFKVRWVGDSYWDTDVRETASLLSISDQAPPGSAHGFPSYYIVHVAGYKYSQCNPPPQIIDMCNF